MSPANCSLGNSLAVRIPGSFVRETGVSYGTEVDISINNGNIIITPIHKEFCLERMLEMVNDENLHGETDTGKPSGREEF